MMQVYKVKKECTERTCVRGLSTKYKYSYNKNISRESGLVTNLKKSASKCDKLLYIDFITNLTELFLFKDRE